MSRPLEKRIPPGGHLTPKCTHTLEQIDGAPKTMEELIKLRVDKTISPIVKKLDNSWAA